MKRLSLTVTVIAVLALVGLTGWLHDFVTLSGAHTVYVAECAGGVWQGTTCTGHLVAGDRYRLKALKPHSEVLYWTAGATKPSGKLTECVIENAKNWSCRQTSDQQQTVTHALRNGHPVVEPGKARPFHSVDKWKWLLLEQGVSVFHEADT
jgi:hypothetical protein